MKNKLRSELRRELRGVRMSEELKERVLAEAEKVRFRQERRRAPLAKLAVAAAVMLVLCLSVGIISANTHRGMPRDNVYTHGNGDWVWVSGGDMLYHFQKSCAGGDGARRMRLAEAKAAGHTACAQCIRIAQNPNEGFGPATPEPASQGTTLVMVAATPEATPQGTALVMVAATPEATPQGTALVMVAATPEATPQGTMLVMVPATPEPASMNDAFMGASATPEPTPVPPAQSEAYEEEMVWLTDNGKFYHSVENCSGMKNAKIVGVTEAEMLGKRACPTCIPLPTPMPTMAAQSEVYEEQTVWLTDNGKFYHFVENCSGMKNAKIVGVTEAEMLGKQACPTCIPLPTPAPTMAAQSEAYEEQTVWMTENGASYHSYQHCPGMDIAKIVDVTEAEKQGKQACTVCIPLPTPMPTMDASAGSDADEERMVWMTDSSVSYHSYQHCPGIDAAKIVGVTEAEKLGKQACPVCIPLPTPAPTMDAADRYIMFFAEPDGSVFHRDNTCTRLMTEAIPVTAKQVAAEGMEPCMACGPELVWMDQEGHYHADRQCAPLNPEPMVRRVAQDAGGISCFWCVEQTMVWMTENGEFMHEAEHCSGMRSAERVRICEAESAGKRVCPVCMPLSTPAPTMDMLVQRADNTVWMDEEGYYHSDRECAPANSERMARSVAQENGGVSCIWCNEAVEEETVWLTDNGKFYHSVETCSGMKNAKIVGITEAEELGKQACPTCMPENAAAVDDSAKSDDEWYSMLENAGVYLETACADGYVAIRSEPVTVWEWLETDQPVEVTFDGEAWQQLMDLCQLESGRFTQERLDQIRAGECTGFRTLRYEVLAWMLYGDDGSEIPVERCWQFKEMRDGDVVITDLLDAGSGVPAVAEAYISTYISEYMMGADGMFTIDSRTEVSSQRAAIRPQGEGYYVQMELREDGANGMTPIVALSIDAAEGRVATSSFESSDLYVHRVVLDGESYVLIGFDGLENPDRAQLEIISTLEVSDGALPNALNFAQRSPANSVAAKVERKLETVNESAVPEAMRNVMQSRVYAPEAMKVTFSFDGKILEIYNEDY